MRVMLRRRGVTCVDGLRSAAESGLPLRVAVIGQSLYWCSMDRVHCARLNFDRPRIRRKHHALQQTLDAAMVSKSNIGCRISTLEEWLHGLFSFLSYTKFIYKCWTRFFRLQDGSMTSVDIRKQSSGLPLCTLLQNSYIHTPCKLPPLELSC